MICLGRGFDFLHAQPGADRRAVQPELADPIGKAAGIIEPTCAAIASPTTASCCWRPYPTRRSVSIAPEPN